MCMYVIYMYWYMYILLSQNYINWLTCKNLLSCHVGRRAVMFEVGVVYVQ